jgi:hypothetical protein
MKKIVKFTVLMAAWAFLAGCAHIPGGISDSTTPINGRQYKDLGRVTGTDTRIMLLGLLPISGSNDIQEAIDDARRKCGADALIEVTVDSYGHYWILWASQTTSVSGIGIKFIKANQPE